MKHVFHSLTVLFLSSVLSVAEPAISCNPRELRGLPGQPLRLTVTVETDRAASIQLKIPAVSNLVLRTVEKIPIRRTEEGRYLQQRTILWQGTEPGQTTLTNLTVVFQTLEKSAAGVPPAFQSSEKKVPAIGITIEAVEPAKPPVEANEEEE